MASGRGRGGHGRNKYSKAARLSSPTNTALATMRSGNTSMALTSSLEPADLSSFEALPQAALCKVFDQLSRRDLAACACACRSWREEADDDRRWATFWYSEHQAGPLSRWGRATGGYREQLAAAHALRHGFYSRKTFPLSRSDGAVREVLLLHGKEQRYILTLQRQRVPEQSVRLVGSTLKVWSEAGLAARKPALVVRDVVHHLHLEQGRLLLWRIKDDEIINTVRTTRGRLLDPALDTARPNWAEHAALVPSMLNAAEAQLQDIQLDSTYGRGSEAYEWTDLPGGYVAASGFRDGVLRCRVLSLEGGACIAAASVECSARGLFTGRDYDVLIISSSTSEPQGRVLLLACLLDHTVYAWHMPDSWFTQQHLQHVQQGGPLPGSAQHQQQDDTAAGPSRRQRYRPEPSALAPLITTPNSEPICDLSVSFPQGRAYVVCMHNMYIHALDGTQLAALSMSSWVGGPPLTDLGAFAWPLPHSERVAVHLDATGGIYVVDMGPSQVEFGGLAGVPGGDRLVATHVAATSSDPPAYELYRVHAHRLRRIEHCPGASTMARFRTNALGPTVVELSSCGGVLASVADAPGLTEWLLRHRSQEADMEQMLAALKDSSGGSTRQKRGRQGGSRGGRGKAAQATCALVMINPATARYMRAVPMSGSIEAVHIAGSSMAVVQGPPQVSSAAVAGSYGGEGSLVLLDFAEGLRRMQQAKAAASSREQRRGGRQSPAASGVMAGSTTGAAATTSFGSVAHARQMQPAAKKRRG